MIKIKLNEKERDALMKASAIITVIKNNPSTERWQGTYDELEEIENLFNDMLHGVQNFLSSPKKYLKRKHHDKKKNEESFGFGEIGDGSQRQSNRQSKTSTSRERS